MAELAKSAVLVSSCTDDLLGDAKQVVVGPNQEDLHSAEAVLNRYSTVGFQASNLARAFSICEMMLTPQSPSPSLMPTEGDQTSESPVMVQPTLFVGVTANLFGTGCREAIRFLCTECVPLPNGVEPATPLDDMAGISCDGTGALKPSPCDSRALIHVLVVSGGAMEHDIRRACESYKLSREGAEEEGEQFHHPVERDRSRGKGTDCHFGNVRYNSSGVASRNLFSCVMRCLVKRLAEAQRKEKANREAAPIPEAYYDVCSWAITPSTLWYMAGLWMADIFTEALQETGEVTDEKVASEEGLKRAKSTVLYWAARNGVPIFSPSLADGDIMEFILTAGDTGVPLLQLDLVADIHRLNRLAMRSRRTGMMILGGGVVKHHVCNANLMRNGADYAVFLNNAQEFDGSDAGARPGEAVSWGKLRLDSTAVKVYSEVTIVFPLIVVHVFVAWVRMMRSKGKENIRS